MSAIESNSNHKKKWTDKEKRNLLKGLKTVGYKNISDLKQFVNTKSENAIRQMINKYHTLADLGQKDDNSPLDIWLRSGIIKREKSFIPEALLFIRLFENHPPPEETAGFDLKQAYELLYEVTQGLPISNISPSTAELLKQLIITVDNEICASNDTSTTDYLISKLSVIESERKYKKRKTN